MSIWFCFASSFQLKAPNLNDTWISGREKLLYSLLECYRALVSLNSLPYSLPIDSSMKRLNSYTHCFQAYIWFLLWGVNILIDTSPLVLLCLLDFFAYSGLGRISPAWLLSPCFIYQLLCYKMKSIHACKSELFPY